MRIKGKTVALHGTFCLACSFAATSICLAQQSEATKRLLARNKMFEPDIIRVADNVYTAIGYTVSANSMIVGDNGVIIVDPGQKMVGARKIREEFEKITD